MAQKPVIRRNAVNGGEEDEVPILPKYHDKYFSERGRSITSKCSFFAVAARIFRQRVVAPIRRPFSRQRQPLGCDTNILTLDHPALSRKTAGSPTESAGPRSTHMTKALRTCFKMRTHVSLKRHGSAAKITQQFSRQASRAATSGLQHESTVDGPSRTRSGNCRSTATS